MMKEKVLKTIHDWLGVLFMIAFWYECGRLTDLYLGNWQTGAVIGLILLGIYCRFDEKK